MIVYPVRSTEFLMFDPHVVTFVEAAGLAGQTCLCCIAKLAQEFTPKNRRGRRARWSIADMFRMQFAMLDVVEEEVMHALC